MNVSGKSKLLAQEPHGLYHLFRDVILIPACAGAEKEPFNIIRPVKGKGDPGQLFRGIGEGFGFVAAVRGIGAVAALMGAVVGVKGLEEADASAVLGEGMANSGQGRLAWREGGRADVMARALSQGAKLLRRPRPPRLGFGPGPVSRICTLLPGGRSSPG